MPDLFEMLLLDWYLRICFWNMTSFDSLCNIFAGEWQAIDFFWPQCACIKHSLKSYVTSRTQFYHDIVTDFLFES